MVGILLESTPSLFPEVVDEEGVMSPVGEDTSTINVDVRGVEDGLRTLSILQ